MTEQEVIVTEQGVMVAEQEILVIPTVREEKEKTIKMKITVEKMTPIHERIDEVTIMAKRKMMSLVTIWTPPLHSGAEHDGV